MVLVENGHTRQPDLKTYKWTASRVLSRVKTHMCHKNVEHTWVRGDYYVIVT